MKKKLLVLLLSMFAVTSFNQSNAQEGAMIGEVKMFAGNFAPRGWMLCQGQILSISENNTLFSIIGTTYGGDGRTTFALPDMRGRVAMGVGSGPGLSNSAWGQKQGTEYNTLNTNQLPAHSHMIQIDTEQNEPVEVMPARDPDSGSVLVNHPLGHGPSNNQTMNTGANQPVNNMQPSLSVYYIICVQGVYPSRQ